MKLFTFFSAVGFCNTYLIGRKDGGDAILIDPGHISLEIINTIEEHKFNLAQVFITHRHETHIKGLGTIMKIYTPTIYAAASTIYDYPVQEISDGDSFIINNFNIRGIHVPGHSLDSMVYQIEHALFTGDTLLSGHIGSTSSMTERALLLKSIKTKLLPLDEHLLVYPGHGAPSTLQIEKLFNRDIVESLMVHD